MNAFRGGRLEIRDDLHLGVGFLAATSGSREPGRLVLARVRTAMGNIAVARAGHPDAEPVVMLHGLGGDQGLLPPHRRGAGRPVPRPQRSTCRGSATRSSRCAPPTTRAFFARAVCGFMDACGIERAHLIGNSMGGRVAFEVGFRNPARAAGSSG